MSAERHGYGQYFMGTGLRMIATAICGSPKNLTRWAAWRFFGDGCAVRSSKPR